MSEYMPKPGDEVLVTFHAKVAQRGPVITESEPWLVIEVPRGGGSDSWHIKDSAIVDVQPAPIPLPTTPGAVVEGTAYGSLRRMFWLSDGDEPRWMSNSGDWYENDAIVVERVLWDGESK